MCEGSAVLLALLAAIFVARRSRHARHPLIRCVLLSVASIAIVVGSVMLVYGGALLHLHGYDRDFLRIDTCLDAGGVWDYNARKCIGRRTR